ncbi:MAG: glycosyltransferase [Rubrivivax sp.]
MKPREPFTPRELVQALMRWWGRLTRGLKRPAEGPEQVLQPATAPPLARLPHQMPPACVSVVIPALNEAARIAEVVRYAAADPATGEVIVVDDSSVDATAALAAEAGAKVVLSSMLGKGMSMADGAREALHECIVYLDGDLTNLQPGIVTQLAQPVYFGAADLVKARFGRSGGRVNELTAKPMLKVFFPELGTIAQPLGGLIGVKRSLMRRLTLESGYGVDVGLLIDAHRANARIVEVDIGSLEHDSQPLLDLSLMANEVSRVIFQRARDAGRLHIDQISAMYETQRLAAASLDYVLTRRRSRTRVLLLDMDGTITRDRFVVALAQASGAQRELDLLLDGQVQDAATRSEAIASLFRFVHRRQFEKTAMELPLRDGVVDCVRAARRAGFMVGVVSDSWFVAAEVVRRRIFADFALAHVLHFEGDVCTGRVQLNPAFMASGRQPEAPLCKRHVVTRIRQDHGDPQVQEIWAVGDNLNDLGMLQEADRAFVIEPKLPSLSRQSDAVTLASFADLEAHFDKVERGGNVKQLKPLGAHG